MRLLEKDWHKFFEIGVVLKAINGTWEIAAGTMILLINKNTFVETVLHFTRGELLEDPNDKIIQYVTHTLQNFSNSTKTFAAIYILFHGIINIFLAIKLFQEKLWAYKVSIALTGTFMLYQLYRVASFHSLPLAIITLADFFFIILAWHEYKYKSRLKKNTNYGLA